MNKIGIVSELNLNNFNYGNRLQSFALNHYINTNYKNVRAISILLNFYDKRIITKHYPFDKIKKIPEKIKKIFQKDNYNYDVRINKSNEFTKKNMLLTDKELSYEELCESDFDKIIVGSDVVWSQKKGEFNTVRFLNFKLKNVFLKYSYAASFASDYIPKENVKMIKKSLSDFKKISVRENSTIELLKSNGIEKVEHVCDPTLLLSNKEWENYSKKPKNIPNNFIFVYLLGKSLKQRNEIKQFSKELGIPLVSIPHANGEFDVVDTNFADYNCDACSPEEWIWLIRNANYVITDSFHGIVFSTIFEKKFIGLARESSTNINNRMIDYLKTIDEVDKLVTHIDISDIKKTKWDYKKINTKKVNFITKSKNYIEEIIYDSQKR